jgi:hypothetical protein
MIGHEHVGMDGAAVMPGRLPQQGAIAGIVLGPEEDRPAIIAALDHVQRLIRQEEPPKPRHRALLRCTAGSLLQLGD